MNRPQRVAFHTLGCKLNFAETSSIARQFEVKGHIRLDFPAEADIYVINTCSVTENADKECKQIVRKALRLSPEAKVVIIGCYAQLKPDKIAEIPGVSLVLGASEKFRILDHLQEQGLESEAQVHACEIGTVDFFMDAFSAGDRTRGFLKVQDGCDYSCTFCTIPLARGKSRSDSIDNAVKNAEKLAKSGIKEIVLTGVNLGDFGKGMSGNKIKDYNFFDLVQELENVEGIDRFRISSIEPNLLSDDIIDFVAQSKKFVPHFHIPLQSGSDAILKLMKRRYLSAFYTSRIEHIIRVMPDACIGVDVITGFPGETDEEFEKTYVYLKNLPIAYLHVFTYSERQNTLATTLKSKVDMVVRKERTHRLRILSDKKTRAFYDSQAGNLAKVLWEGDNKNGFMHGYTRNYVKVRRTYDESYINTISDIMLCDIAEDGSLNMMEQEPVLS